MVITRIINGIEVSITLTDKECADVFDEVTDKCRRDDVECALESGEYDMDFTEEEKDDIVKLFTHYLNNNDCYWDSYWITLDDAIDECIREKKLRSKA